MSVNVRVEARPDRRFDIVNLLRRFKRACNEFGVTHEFKRHEYYEKPCEKRNRRRRQTELVRKYALEEQKFPQKVKARGKKKGVGHE